MIFSFSEKFHNRVIKLVKINIKYRGYNSSKQKIYIKCFFYLNLVNHKGKADSLYEYPKEKIIINQNNNSNEEKYKKKDSKNSNLKSNDIKLTVLIIRH